MSSGLFDGARQRFLKGSIAWESADIRQLLVKDTYTFDPAHEFVADVVAHELSATDYARQSVAGRSVGPSHPTYALATDVQYAGLGGAVNQVVGGAIFYLHTGSDATAVVIAFIDTADITTQDQLTVIRIANGRVFSWGG